MLVIGALSTSAQHKPHYEWGGFRENMGLWATIGRHVGKKLRLCGRKVGVGIVWVNCV